MTTWNRTVIQGAILIISCHKHKETRLKQFKLSKKEYDGWKVFVVIGNPDLQTDFALEDKEEYTLLTIRCENSYIHILKKVVLSCKIILYLYDVQQGILRCGDDLVFNENKLSQFLNNTNKTDYMGVLARTTNKMFPMYNNFMPDYFNSHPEDLKSTLNAIPYTLDEIQKFNVVPCCNYTGGVIFYLSVYSCIILIQHLENINWNVFEDDIQYGYPYIIEDIGVGFILSSYNILPVSCKLYSNNEIDAFNESSPCIAYHTNKYK